MRARPAAAGTHFSGDYIPGGPVRPRQGLLTDRVGVIPETPPETLQRARLTVCSYANSVTDAKRLLAVLGIGPDG